MPSGLILWILVGFVAGAANAVAQEPPPELTQPVNDFAGVVDDAHEASMAALIRSLQQASGDVVVVATIPTFKPYGDIREYAVRMFENRGRGIGQQGKDNGALILLAVDDRQVWVEVGYDLEQFITDGFAGEVSRRTMAPEFRRGEYGAGLLAGLTRIVNRIADGRNVTLPGVTRTRRPDAEVGQRLGSGVMIALFAFIILLRLAARAVGLGGRRRFGRRGWGGYYGGWHSGVGPFGGGGFGGGGFGGGFGGFGGGRSGGGGGGGAW